MVWSLSAWALLSLPNVSLLSLKRKTSNKINICFRNCSDSQFFMKFRPLKRNKDYYSPLENTFLLLVPERRTSSVLVWAFHCLPEDTPLGETITWRVSLQIDWPWLVPKDCSVMVGRGRREISRKTRASWLQALFLMVSCMLSVRKDYGKSITVSPKLHCVTRSPILWPWSSSQHGEARQLDSHHPIFQWVSHPSLLSCFVTGTLAGLRSLNSEICFLFLSSWLLLAHLGVSVNRPRHTFAAQFSEVLFCLLAKAVRWSGLGRQGIIPLPLLPVAQVQPLSTVGTCLSSPSLFWGMLKC